MKLSPSDIDFLNEGHLWVVKDTSCRIILFWFSHVSPCRCGYDNLDRPGPPGYTYLN